MERCTSRQIIAYRIRHIFAPFDLDQRGNAGARYKTPKTKSERCVYV
jgi:hypothetical protein